MARGTRRSPCGIPAASPCAGTSWLWKIAWRHFCWPWSASGIEGQTFLIAMNDPFDYPQAADYAAERLGIDVVDLVDPIGQDFCIDTTKARYQLGYQPKIDIYQLIDQAVEFRRSGRPRRQASGYQG